MAWGPSAADMLAQPDSRTPAMAARIVTWKKRIFSEYPLSTTTHRINPATPPFNHI